MIRQTIQHLIRHLIWFPIHHLIRPFKVWLSGLFFWGGNNFLLCIETYWRHWHHFWSSYLQHPPSLLAMVANIMVAKIWCYARHSTGHMLATHALAPISFGERGRVGREDSQYFVFNSRTVVRFLSTRYGSYFGRDSNSKIATSV